MLSAASLLLRCSCLFSSFSWALVVLSLSLASFLCLSLCLSASIFSFDRRFRAGLGVAGPPVGVDPSVTGAGGRSLCSVFVTFEETFPIFASIATFDCFSVPLSSDSDRSHALVLRSTDILEAYDGHKTLVPTRKQSSGSLRRCSQMDKRVEMRRFCHSHLFRFIFTPSLSDSFDTVKNLKYDHVNVVPTLLEQQQQYTVQKSPRCNYSSMTITCKSPRNVIIIMLCFCLDYFALLWYWQIFSVLNSSKDLKGLL